MLFVGALGRGGYGSGRVLLQFRVQSDAGVRVLRQARGGSWGRVGCRVVGTVAQGALPTTF